MCAPCLKQQEPAPIDPSANFIILKDKLMEGKGNDRKGRITIKDVILVLRITMFLGLEWWWLRSILLCQATLSLKEIWQIISALMLVVMKIFADSHDSTSQSTEFCEGYLSELLLDDPDELIKPIRIMNENLTIQSLANWADCSSFCARFVSNFWLLQFSIVYTRC